jgi:hypothetical protein
MTEVGKKSMRIHGKGLLTHLLTTYFMEQSTSLEAKRFSASQEIPRILWNPKAYYRIHTCPPPAPILSQFDPIHDPTAQFLKIHLVWKKTKVRNFGSYIVHYRIIKTDQQMH